MVQHGGMVAEEDEGRGHGEEDFSIAVFDIRRRYLLVAMNEARVFAINIRNYAKVYREGETGLLILLIQTFLVFYKDN